MTVITWLKDNWCKVLAGLILFIILPAMSAGLWFVSMCSTNYACYLWIKELPVMILLGLSVCIMFAHLSLLEWCPCNPTLKVVEVVFTRFLKNRNPNNREEEKLFTVFGYEANLKDMHWLFIILVQATLLAFAQFWDDFLLEASSSCSADSNLHCFYTTDPLLPYQELNCLNTSQVEEEATSIICYKYVFNTGRAAASAIGIMSATGLIIYTVCIVFLTMLDGAKWPTCLIVIAKLIAVFEILLFCAVLGGLQLTHTNHATGVFGKITSFLKTLSMVLMTAGSVFFLPVNQFRKLQNIIHVRVQPTNDQ